jgi:hypothetical protein
MKLRGAPNALRCGARDTGIGNSVNTPMVKPNRAIEVLALIRAVFSSTANLAYLIQREGVGGALHLHGAANTLGKERLADAELILIPDLPAVISIACGIVKR